MHAVCMVCMYGLTSVFKIDVYMTKQMYM